jgi:hypothetical protein
VAALIGKEVKQGEIQDHSKRLLKLELLALNFGDSIFLSPLFAELERDLRLHELSKPEESVQVSALIKRLRSLAKRVASSQLSFLVQRGTSIPISVPIVASGDKFCNEKAEYKWPDDSLAKDLMGLKFCINEKPPDASASSVASDTEMPYCQQVEGKDYIPVEMFNQGLIDMVDVAPDQTDDEKRYVTAVFSDPNPNDKSVRVSVTVCPLKDAPDCVLDDPQTIERTFTLDYFNFPTIDNTRLPDNDRLAVVLDNFQSSEPNSKEEANRCNLTFEVSVVFFPSEYASLRDRPTMLESLEMLERAQEHSPEKKETQL